VGSTFRRRLEGMRRKTCGRQGLPPFRSTRYICAMNAYWRWAGTGSKVAYLKEEQKVLATLTPEQIRQLASFKPKGMTLPFDHCDFDNLVVKVRGKGGKHRLVPLSVEMRKTLYRCSTKHSGPGRLMFGTRNRTPTPSPASIWGTGGACSTSRACWDTAASRRPRYISSR
jgi:hypothetical protein